MAASMLRSYGKLNYRNLMIFAEFPTITARKFSASGKLFDSFNIQDNDDFKERVLDSKTPVVVQFHASWCGPCKILGPRLESIAMNYNEKVHLAKIDVDENADLAFEYEVSSIPAVVGIKSGKLADKFVGVKDEDEIKSFIDKLVGC